MTAFACLTGIVGCFWLMIFIQYKISQGHCERIEELEDKYVLLEQRVQWIEEQKRELILLKQRVERIEETRKPDR